MAGETSIDTGIGTGEAQVFRLYQDRGLTGQAEIGIEQDKIARVQATADELKKNLSDVDKNIKEFKGDGILPGVSDVFKDAVLKVYNDTTEGYKNQLDKKDRYGFQNKINGDSQVLIAFMNENKAAGAQLNQANKLRMEGKLDDKSNAILDILGDKKFFNDLYAKGASLPEIGGKVAALLSGIREKEPEVKYSLPKGLSNPLGYGSENKTTGETRSGVTFNKDQANEAAKLEIERLKRNPAEYDAAMKQYGSEDALIKDYVAVSKANTNISSKQGFENRGNGFEAGGSGVAKINGILAKFNPYSIETISGRNYANIDKRKEGSNSGQVRVKLKEGDNLGMVRLEHPDKGLSNKTNKFKDYTGNFVSGKVVGLDNATGKDVVISYVDGGEEFEKVVPYKDNEVQTSDYLNGSDYDAFFQKAIEASGNITEIKKESPNNNSGKIKVDY